MTPAGAARPADGRWVRAADLRDRPLSGWALELDPILPRRREDSGTPDVSRRSSGIGTGLEHGALGRFRWWCWSSPGDTAARAIITRTGDVVLFDGRLDDRHATARLLGDRSDQSDAVLASHAVSRWGARTSDRLLGDFALAQISPASERVVVSIDIAAVGECWWWQPESGALVATTDPLLLARWAGPTDVDVQEMARHLSGTHPTPGRTVCRTVGRAAAGRPAIISGPAVRLLPPLAAPVPAVPLVRDPREAQDALAAALVEAAADRLRPGPGVILLSGGVDSTVAAAAAAHAGGLRAAVGFASRLEGVDERPCSTAVAARLGIDHHAVDVDARAPFAPTPDADADWALRPGAPGPFDPFRLAFAEAVDAAYGECRALGGRTVWGGDRGDLVIGGGTPSPFRTIAAGLRSAELAAARAGFVDLAIDRRRRGLRATLGLLGSHLRRPRAPLAAPGALGAWLPDAPPTWEPPRPLHPLERRWWLWRSPFVDRIVGHSTTLARRRGLRVVDPWSDRRVAQVVCSIASPLVDPPRSHDKTLGRAVANQLLGGWAPPLIRNGISPLWRHGVRGTGAPVVRDLAREPQLASLGVDLDLLRGATEEYLAEQRPLAELAESWAAAWWLRAWHTLDHGSTHPERKMTQPGH